MDWFDPAPHRLQCLRTLDGCVCVRQGQVGLVNLCRGESNRLVTKWKTGREFCTFEVLPLFPLLQQIPPSAELIQGRIIYPDCAVCHSRNRALGMVHWQANDFTV